MPSIAQWPAEQSNPPNVRRERQRVLRARVAGWPEWVEASQGGSVEWLTPCLREARAICSILSGSSGHVPPCRLVMRSMPLPFPNAILDEGRSGLEGGMHTAGVRAAQFSDLRTGQTRSSGGAFDVIAAFVRRHAVHSFRLSR